MMKIGTHSGPFHADEALAVYMLKKLPKFRSASVVRTRDYEILDTCDIVVDVRAKYEPPKYFDHHQREFNTSFDANHVITKLSSAGLVYKHFGRDILKEMLNELPDAETTIDGIFDKLYERFIEPVDALDNGVNATAQEPKYHLQGVTLQSVVANLAPAWTEDDSPAEFDAQFAKASELMGLAFDAAVNSLARGWWPARKIVAAAMAKRHEYDSEGRLLVFDEYVPWKDHLSQYEDAEGAHILYVLYPAADSFRIQAVNKPSSFETRLPLPEAWRGRRDDELNSITGLSDCVFVHAAGFIGGARSKESALKLAAQALEQPYNRE